MRENDRLQVEMKYLLKDREDRGRSLRTDKDIILENLRLKKEYFITVYLLNNLF